MLRIINDFEPPCSCKPGPLYTAIWILLGRIAVLLGNFIDNLSKKNDNRPNTNNYFFVSDIQDSKTVFKYEIIPESLPSFLTFSSLQNILKICRNTQKMFASQINMCRFQQAVFEKFHRSQFFCGNSFYKDSF